MAGSGWRPPARCLAEPPASGRMRSLTWCRSVRARAATAQPGHGCPVSRPGGAPMPASPICGTVLRTGAVAAGRPAHQVLGPSNEWVSPPASSGLAQVPPHVKRKEIPATPCEADRGDASQGSPLLVNSLSTYRTLRSDPNSVVRPVLPVHRMVDSRTCRYERSDRRGPRPTRPPCARGTGLPHPMRYNICTSLGGSGSPTESASWGKGAAREEGCYGARRLATPYVLAVA